ncbi:MAG: hypothetical protein Q3976_09020 [Corynebacterium sp.]|nr:hypothetical protein [Corynebacterium sp.]
MAAETVVKNKISDAVIQQVADELGHYVYALVDPRDGVPFYVGKGTGSRFAAHGKEALWTFTHGEIESVEEEKLVNAKLHKIKEANFEPDIWILRYGLTKSEYTSVEAACIDILRSFPVIPLNEGSLRLPDQVSAQLTNLRKEASRGHGIVRLDTLIAEKGAPVLEYDKPLLIITLGPWVNTSEDIPGGKKRQGYGYKKEWLESSERLKHYQEIGESCCSWWKLSERTIQDKGIEYVVAAHRGVTRGLFRIKPNTWEAYSVSNGNGEPERRIGWQFDIVDSGDVFDQVVGSYGHILSPKPKQNQHYWPFK